MTTFYGLMNVKNKNGDIVFNQIYQFSGPLFIIDRSESLL